MDRKYKVEVIADSSGTWAGNALEFDTEEQAEIYARDLASRWTAVRRWRVVPVKPMALEADNEDL